MNHVKFNQFQACADDAAIIIDACSAGEGDKNIAEAIANANPGKKVFAPSTDLFFSKPIFTKNNDSTSVSEVVHGPGLFKAHTAKKFQLLPT